VYWGDGVNGGNMWSGWSAYLSFFRHVAKLDLPEYERWQHYESAAIHGGPRFIHKHFWIVSDFPTTIGRDEQNRAHSATGPQIAWRDGWAAWFWHGTQIPGRVIEDPESYTAAELRSESNSEVLRAIGEKLGWARALEKMGCVTIDKWIDPITGLDYELLDLEERKGDRQPRWLRMRSPMVLDGTQPLYVEKVHPELRSAQAARKWQFRLPDGRWPTPDECNHDSELRFAEER
jgi:hypothetical protein